MNKKLFTCNLNIKSACENGIIKGYGSVFDNIDSDNDRIIKGAFTNSIKQHNQNNKIKLLWQHHIHEPIGTITHLSEDDHGLYIEAKLLLGIARANEAYKLVKSGAIKGLSIGFRVEESFYENDQRVITEVDLWEVSLVTFPANELALVTSTKNFSPIGDFINGLNLEIKKAIKILMS
jgi:HK97 family phage prohead protease